MAGPGERDRNRLAVALVLHVLFVALITAILVVLIAIHPVLIRARTLGRFPIAIAEMLLTAILVPPGRPLFALLIFVSFLVGHEIPPRHYSNASTVPCRLILPASSCGTTFCNGAGGGYG